MTPSAAPPVPSPSALRAAGTDAGLDVVEITTAEPFVEVRRTLEARKAAGLHGGMAFTYRQPARSTDPEAALRSARALVVGARSYLVDLPDAEPGAPSGRIARYAWDDHYAHLKYGLAAVAAVLKQHGWRARVLADDNAMVDRAAAHRAGIGWWGKNANLLLPGLGSWYVLGSVVTDAPLVGASAPLADRCGSCTRCLDGCPTGAITAPGVVDARRCLSWLLQAEGSFPIELRRALGDRIYGCDDCQEVCPPNRRAPAAPPTGRERPWAPLLELLDPDDAAVLHHADRWYIPKREVRYVRRNALIVLGNVGDGRDAEVAEVIRRHLHHADPLLRGHAVWAARRLGREDLLHALAHEEDPFVLEELAAPGP
jgi:epoxyqueuosine reductase